MGSSVVLATAGYDHTIRYAPLPPPATAAAAPQLSALHSRPKPLTTPPPTPPPTHSFWEATSGICYRTLQHPDSQVNRLEVSADKALVAAAGNPHVRVFDVAGGGPAALMSFDGHGGAVTAVGFHKDGGCWVVWVAAWGRFVWCVHLCGFCLECVVQRARFRTLNTPPKRAL
jgi:WD40 repeat protein